MATATDNLVLEHLRHIRGKVDVMSVRLESVELRVGAIERVLTGNYITKVNQNQEMDRLKTRVDRIERRRLELAE